MKINIRIGHPAYPQMGLNRSAYCKTKTEAVEELRDRGVTRDVAREAVKDVLTRSYGHRVVYAPGDTECIEVFNCD